MRRPAPALLSLLLSASALAAEGQDYSYITNADDTTLTITGYLGFASVVSIPSTINGMVVNSLGGTAFAYDSGLESVTIPDSVTNLGGWGFGNSDTDDGPFEYCSSLTNVVLSTNLIRIGDFTFIDCASLANVSIPASVTWIGQFAFGYSGLTSIAIPSAATRLATDIFWSCESLTNAMFPGGVGPVPDGAFAGCSNLSAITIANGATGIGGSTFFNCTSLTNITLPASIIGIGDTAFEDCSNLAGLYFQGNAPQVGAEILYPDNNATVYYLAGASGWTAAFDYRPVVLWNPLIRTDDVSYGLQSNHFGFNITGTANIPIVIESCTNLKSDVWTPRQTVTLTNGSIYFTDSAQMNTPGRYYRLSPP